MARVQLTASGVAEGTTSEIKTGNHTFYIDEPRGRIHFKLCWARLSAAKALWQTWWQKRSTLIFKEYLFL